MDLKLDGQAYEPGFIYDEETHTLTFKVETVSGYEVDYVSCNGAILSAVDGVYEVPFVKGVEISIATRAAYAYKASLSLSGDIAMNFFLRISDEAMQAEGAKVIFTFKGVAGPNLKVVADGVIVKRQYRRIHALNKAVHVRGKFAVFPSVAFSVFPCAVVVGESDGEQ